MAPTKTVKRSNKTSSSSGKPLGASRGVKSTRVSKKPSSSSSSSTSASKSSGAKRPPPKEHKTKRPVSGSGGSGGVGKKKGRRHYTEKELGIPQLNMVTPIGVSKPKGKKKGKVFVDDAQSMMTIMAMVNAEKEGQIESKMLRARQMEEIRLLKRQEQEEREAQRRERLEETKDSLRKKRRKGDKGQGSSGAGDGGEAKAAAASTKRDGKKKRVSFG